MKLLRYLPLLLAAIAASCDIHDLPETSEPTPTPEPDPTTRTVSINLVHEGEMALHGEYFYSDGSLSSTASRSRDDEAAAHHIRYTIKAYPASRGEISRAEDASMTFTREIADGLDTTIDVTIPLGDHTFIVWTDYVDKGTTTDKYYCTDDFAEVILASSSGHSGSNTLRDAFHGSMTAADDESSITIEMKRPMARYTFVTTDLQRFLDSETASKSSRSLSLDDYTVKFIYPRYVTCSFNLFTERTADSWSGLTYTSTIKQLSDDEAELGFDYVIVNDAETAVTVGAEIYDAEGTLVARIPSIDVPLLRSSSTIVKGEFLSTTADGPATINPDFDGSFNIEIK